MMTLILSLAVLVAVAVGMMAGAVYFADVKHS